MLKTLTLRLPGSTAGGRRQPIGTLLLGSGHSSHASSPGWKRGRVPTSKSSRSGT